MLKQAIFGLAPVLEFRQGRQPAAGVSLSRWTLAGTVATSSASVVVPARQGA